MNICVAPYQDSLAENWDSFVLNESRNGGIFQERRFLGYHPQNKFVDESLIFWMGKDIVGILPVAQLITSKNKLCAFSHPGSTAGGLIYHREMTLREVLLMLELAIEYFQKKHFDRLELRLAESIFSYPSDGELFYLLWHRGFQLVTREISSSVNLEDEKNWLTMGRKRNLGIIRSLIKKDIKVCRVHDPQIIYPVVVSTLKERYQKLPTHSLEELSDLKSRYPERIHFWAVKKEDICIATIVVFVVNKCTVHAFYIAQDYQYSNLRAMPLLFYEAYSYYQSQGFKWFNLGLSSRGDWIKWGILEFKEHVGARATFKDVWALDNLANYQPYTFDNHE